MSYWCASDGSVADEVRSAFADHRSDWQSVNDRTFGIGDTRLRFSARILAGAAEAGEFAWTVSVSCTLWQFHWISLTVLLGISNKSWRTATYWSMVDHLTLRSCWTVSRTRVSAFVVVTRQEVRTVWVL